MPKRLGKFELPSKLTKVEEGATPTYAKFIAEPFEAGYGHTVGNSLRRVLLSSIEGAAISSIKIDGVNHEFQSIDGVVEDVTDIVLNLKEVRLRIHEGQRHTGVVDLKGPRELKAGDLDFGPGVTVLNPEHHIATLGPDGHIHMELVAKRGSGYATADRNKEDDAPVGTINLDAVFSPVRKVNFVVSSARVGQRTDYDKLILDVTTNGSIDPKEAIARGAEILIRQLAIFTDIEKIEGFGAEAPAVDGAPAAEVSLAHGMEIRVADALRRPGPDVNTAEDLARAAAALAASKD